VNTRLKFLLNFPKSSQKLHYELSYTRFSFKANYLPFEPSLKEESSFPFVSSWIFFSQVNPRYAYCHIKVHLASVEFPLEFGRHFFLSKLNQGSLEYFYCRDGVNT
jgi:hypothetical protein